MGTITFEHSTKVEFEDRLLAHLEHVITARLRRGESFTFTWKEDTSVGGGRTTVWLHPRMHIVYKFHGARKPQLNPAWLHALGQTSYGPDGLYIVPEPQYHDLSKMISSRPPMQFRLSEDPSDPDARP
ncbi:ATP-dependent DNA ligase [Microbacterium sp. NPDC091313]